MARATAPQSAPAVRSDSQSAPAVRPLRAWIRRAAIACGVYPHITLNRVEFKTFEFRELLRLARLRRSDRVLDLGCGTGTQTLIVGRRCREIVGVDTNPQAIETARRYADRFAGVVRAEFRLGGVEAQGLAPESFDKVLSFCVIEHIPNYREVLAELHRVLKPGGSLILSADALEGIDDPELIARHRAENFVHQYFRSDSLREALVTAGFTVETLYPIFRSRYARRRFEDGIRRGFAYGYVEALAGYTRLRLHEALSRQRDRGIFLVARCHKAVAPAE